MSSSFEIQFTDNTINEACGEYEQVKRIMADEITQDWVIKSDVIIIYALGVCKIVIDMYNDGRIYITDYIPSNKDIYNEDIRLLKRWCMEYGWQTPQPIQRTIDSWPDFWKNLWETYIIDSSVLDKRYGERQEKEFSDDTE